MTAAAKIVGTALSIVREYPLCDRCLGRLFALLGRGHTNEERGRALKLLILKSIHMALREGDEEAETLLRQLAPNLGPVAARLYEEVFGEPLNPKPCFICGGLLDDVINKAAEAAARELASSRVETFLVAAHVPDYVIKRENELRFRFKLAYTESIKAEIRREVSKRLQRRGLRPDFESPDALVSVYFEPFSVTVYFMPLLLMARYKKLGRRISQSTWLTREGLKYPYSVEMAFSTLARAAEGAGVVLHAAGREDVDVRMLGNGRPAVIEIKQARVRDLDLSALGERVRQASGGLIEAFFEGRARRKDVRSIKEAAEEHLKVYRALVVTSAPIDESALARLEDFFRGRQVKQRTPRRVRHRRPDVVRTKTVHSVKARLIAPNVFEALVVADAGLYIKELVDGDGGDTSPSFAEVLGTDAYCAELDVVYIIHEAHKGLATGWGSDRGQAAKGLQTPHP